MVTWDASRGISSNRQRGLRVQVVGTAEAGSTGWLMEGRWPKGMHDTIHGIVWYMGVQEDDIAGWGTRVGFRGPAVRFIS